MLRVVSGAVFCHVNLLQFLFSTMCLMQGNVESWDVYSLCMHCYLHENLNQIAVIVIAVWFVYPTGELDAKAMSVPEASVLQR